MMQAAENISRRILGNSEDGVPKGKYAGDQFSIHRYEELFWDFTRAAVICLGGRVAQDHEVRLIAGVISFIVGLASSYFIGKHWVDRAESSEDEQRVRYERVERLPKFSQYDTGNRDMRMIKKVLSLEEEVFTKIKRNAEYGLAIRIGLFVAAILGIAGGVTGTSAFLTLSIGIGAATTVGWLLAEGFNFSAGEQRRAAHKMQEALTLLKRHSAF